MIAFKVLFANGTSTNRFNETHIGGAGGQPDMGGYIISTSTTNVTITLPPASLSEGRWITFLAPNSNTKNVQINPASSADVIVVTAGIVTALSATVALAQTHLQCDGARWWAHGDGSFA